MTAVLKQRPVWVYAGAFVLFALCAFAYFLATGHGFTFFVMTAPWGFFFPTSFTESAGWDAWVYPVSWMLILLNAVLFGALMHKLFRPRDVKKDRDRPSQTIW